MDQVYALQNTPKLFIHAFDAYSEDILAGRFPQSTDYMATATCTQRGYDRPKKLDRKVNHFSLWVCPELLKCASVKEPHTLQGFLTERQHIYESVSTYRHADITLEPVLVPTDNLLLTFRDPSFRVRPHTKQVKKPPPTVIRPHGHIITNRNQSKPQLAKINDTTP